MMDNALAHQASHVIDKLTNTLGMTISFGPVATPTTRPNIERSFGTIEREALHRLPYTVGSSPDDKRRNEKAKEHAISDHFTFDKLQAFLDVTYCTYNNSPNRHNREGVSPLAEIRRLCINAGMLPITADEGMLTQVKKLHWKTAVCTVRGSIESGRRPYIQFRRIEYRSEKLSSNYYRLTDSNGKPQKVVIEYDPDNMRTIRVYTADKYDFIGEVHATGKWNFDHTEQQHEEMLRMENSNNKTGDKFSMPAVEYVSELRKKAGKERRARTKADVASKTISEPQKAAETQISETVGGKASKVTMFISSDRRSAAVIEDAPVVKRTSEPEFWVEKAYAEGLSTKEVYNMFFSDKSEDM